LEAGAHPGLIYYQLHDYGPMLEAMRNYVSLNPGHWLGHNLLGVAYQGSGQTLLAIPEYQKAVEYSGHDSDPTASLAYAYARTGKRAEAEKILRDLLEQSRTNYVSPYMIATIYAGLGNKDRAFEYLEKAYDERSADLSYFLRADLRMDTLRSDRRFQDLAKHVDCRCRRDFSGVARSAMGWRLRSYRPMAAITGSNYPPAEPEALRLLAPQRGLIATDQSQKQLLRTAVARNPMHLDRERNTPGFVKLPLPPRQSRGLPSY
jgi:tetratricopeptide (TPR) repeat protein